VHQRPDHRSFPMLTVTLALLTLDRYLGTHFFTNDWAAT
jgi:cytochrome o ubiquinol oxidase subunit 1